MNDCACTVANHAITPFIKTHNMSIGRNEPGDSHESRPLINNEYFFLMRFTTRIMNATMILAMILAMIFVIIFSINNVTPKIKSRFLFL